MLDRGGYRMQGTLVVQKHLTAPRIQLIPVDPKPLHPAMNKYLCPGMRGKSMFCDHCLGLSLLRHGGFGSTCLVTSFIPTWPSCAAVWCDMYLSQLGLIKKYHTVWLKLQISIFSHFWRLKGQGAIGVGTGKVSLFWIADGHLLAVFSHSLSSDPAWGERERSLVSLPPIRVPAQLD